MAKKPTIHEVIDSFDAGIFAQKAMESLKLVAMGAVATQKTGSVTITIKVKPVNENGYVEVEHGMKFIKPTKSGKSSEEAATKTPMFADNLGYLTLNRQDQDDLFPKETGIRGV